MFDRKPISDDKAKKILSALISKLQSEIGMHKVRPSQRSQPTCLPVQNFFRTNRHNILLAVVSAAYVMLAIAAMVTIVNEIKKIPELQTNATTPAEITRSKIMTFGSGSLFILFAIASAVTCMLSKSCLPANLPPLTAPDNTIPTNTTTIAHPDRKLSDLILNDDQKTRLKSLLKKIAERVDAKKDLNTKRGITELFFDEYIKSESSIFSVSLVNCIKLLEKFTTLMDNHNPENIEGTSKPTPILTKTIKYYLEDFALAMQPKPLANEQTPLNRVVIND